MQAADLFRFDDIRDISIYDLVDRNIIVLSQVQQQAQGDLYFTGFHKRIT